ncbi:hypothetical protein ABC766_09330 [Methylobacterium fujisawaense]|uniref:hypothetical protein n=1 Tax=Methylobacterium fujisawaense TaxID=107400 RepID=UPI0031F52666
MTDDDTDIPARRRFLKDGVAAVAGLVAGHPIDQGDRWVRNDEVPRCPGAPPGSCPDRHRASRSAWFRSGT